MKKCILILGLVLPTLGASAQSQSHVTDSAQPLTLQEALRIALEKNPGIKAADA